MPQQHGHAARQSFYGAADLDIAALANGRTVTLPQIYPAALAAVHVDLALDRSHWTNATVVTLEVSNGGGQVTIHNWNSSSSRGFDFHAGPVGWYTMRLTATGLPQTMPFELDVQYTAPQTL